MWRLSPYKIPLKHKSVPELLAAKIHCEGLIKKHGSIKAGQEERLKWINVYLYEKTPIVLTMAEIEKKLGHKVTLR